MAMFYDETVSTNVCIEDDDYAVIVSVTVPMRLNEWEAFHLYCRAIYNNGDKVKAIKTMRNGAGLGLRDAKYLCEQRNNQETQW